MRLASCEHPVIVHNPYLDKDISVPCGHCNTCLCHKAKSWIDRLELERHYSTYTIFFTLTYAEKYLPLLDLGWNDSDFLPSKLVHVKRDFSELTNNRNNKQLSDEYNTFEVSFVDTIYAEQSTQNIRRLHAGCIPYCSVYDCQTFVKRLRSRCYRLAYGTDKGLKDSQKIRYYISSEYGPTSLRPHYHGLFFFDDPRIASYISDVFTSCWLFGRIEFEYVETTATSYVAQYVNSIGRLPRIYRETALRPFSLSSRRVPIGLRALTDESIKELFDSSSCLVSLPNVSEGIKSYVPLWRSLEDRFYPKLPRNSSLSAQLRLELLGTFTRLSQDTMDSFASDLAFTVSADTSSKSLSNLRWYLELCYPLLVHGDFSYVCLFANFRDNEYIKRIYYTTRRISILLFRYHISIVDYCSRFERYQSNKELYLLQTQYLFEENFVLHSDSRFLLNIDNVFYSRCRSLSWNELTPTLLLQLESFGFSYSELKQVYADEKVKKSYFRQLHMSRSMDFIEMQGICKKIISDSRKIRKKNEYLEKHPELKTLY